ncbi:MAG: competence protein [Acidobacteria bacterium]|nr:competence protein [Acidobacteriota bacterium]
MAAQHLINVDLAQVKVPASEGRGALTRILGWGDEVEVVKITSSHVEVKVTVFQELEDGSIKPERVSGFITPKKNTIRPADIVVARKDSRILKIDFVDVQQGDGSVIETPQGKIITVDGGDNQLFARYLANRFRGTRDARPREIDCVLVTHGDADHFEGLTQIHESETDPRLESQKWKRLFIHPQRVYHNGIVKRSSTKSGVSRKETEMLGPVKTVTDPETGNKITILTGLESNLLNVPDEEMNAPFLAWKNALKAYRKRGPIEFRRLQVGDDAAFDFLKEEGIRVQVLGPITTQAGNVQGLKFLGNPPKGPRTGHESLNVAPVGFSGFSASHTINGHSIIFRLNYGRFNFLFTGDLNDEAGRALTQAHNRGDINLQSEVFKVPHHGSADFSGAFIRAVSPVISVISSGDETARKEFIHPRATIVGTLGKHSRVEEPLIFVTELVAFFEVVGQTNPEFHKISKGKAVIENGQAVINSKARKGFFAFRRTAFGIVMVRTDGERLFVYTNSGQASLKEAYAYTIDEFGRPAPAEVRKV